MCEGLQRQLFNWGQACMLFTIILRRGSYLCVVRLVYPGEESRATRDSPGHWFPAGKGLVTSRDISTGLGPLHLLSINKQNQPYIYKFINRIKSFCNQYRLILSVVQPFFKTLNYQSFSRLSNQLVRITLSLKIIYSSNKQLSIQINLIIVTHL